MKKITILLFLLYVNIINAQSFFKNIDLVDEFGDKIGEVQGNVSIGFFSNSATSNSPLRVQTILEEIPDFKNLDEYKEFSRKQLKKLGYSERKIKTALKYAKKSIKITRTFNGYIRFKLYEYKDLNAKITGVKMGIISIKTSEGKKIKAKLSSLSFREGAVIITGYKELKTGLSGVKTLIKSGLYDWSQSEIYNEIVNPKGKVMVVITFRDSTYKFTLE
ncbi:hypothetical protein [Tenacibaculum finnmarkense]|uniref:hypothetical protein n=1 Tax=Tenacibaculum finnmarkense TaxID=2781243 RepID=UPI00187B82FA|nr:hypothetical protein [Tenacibaculum finnmarkense]MBE7646140.1 hypothetical protein [Tenacibaculum finnmarkense genomovar ulcerans]MCG8750045.1 hypothetical protein [Tenacibaculum finnmarkense]MCG8796265.1 hypothetical protein [Tenacibaculum finnmarkense]MCG8798595.1 hypothetical protein [Tenacibaculum finnmarkense]